MTKVLPLLLCLTLSLTGSAQNIQLFSETFNLSPTTTFALNTSSLGAPVGPNRWIVNGNYSGAPLYPNTKSQDSTVSGTIAGAPYSPYLHIHDVNAAVSNGISNANYNPNAASDNFTEMTATI